MTSPNPRSTSNEILGAILAAAVILIGLGGVGWLMWDSYRASQPPGIDLGN